MPATGRADTRRPPGAMRDSAAREPPCSGCYCYEKIMSRGGHQPQRPQAGHHSAAFGDGGQGSGDVRHQRREDGLRVHEAELLQSALGGGVLARVAGIQRRENYGADRIGQGRVSAIQK
jgi:hypothetical protein